MLVGPKRKSTMLIVIIFVLIISGLTLLRENIFLEINSVIEGRNGNQAYFYFFNEFFNASEIPDLKKLKWILTLVFSVVISLMSIYSIHLWFKKQSLTKVVILIYCGIFSFVLLFGFITWLTNYFNECYFILRKVLGFVQSPLPLLVLFTTFYYLSSIENNK